MKPIHRTLAGHDVGLFMDSRVGDCQRVAEFLDEQNIIYYCVPVSGLFEPKLTIGINTFEGYDKIVDVVSRLVKEEDTDSPVRQEVNQ